MSTRCQCAGTLGTALAGYEIGAQAVLALGGEAGGWQPRAVIAISPPPATEQFRNIATGISGGLITSTLMTLVVIPVAYMLMDDLIAVIKRIYLVDQPTAAERDKAMALMESGSKEPPSPAQGVEQPVSPEQEVGRELVEGGGGGYRAAE